MPPTRSHLIAFYAYTAALQFWLQRMKSWFMYLSLRARDNVIFVRDNLMNLVFRERQQQPVFHRLPWLLRVRHGQLQRYYRANGSMPMPNSQMQRIHDSHLDEWLKHNLTHSSHRPVLLKINKTPSLCLCGQLIFFSEEAKEVANAQDEYGRPLHQIMDVPVSVSARGDKFQGEYEAQAYAKHDQ